MLATQGGRPSFPRVQQQALEAVISSTAGKKVFAKLKKQLWKKLLSLLKNNMYSET